MKSIIQTILSASFCALLFASCQSEEAQPLGRTPLGIGNLTISAAGQATDTRAAAADYFQSGDEITVSATPMPGYSVAYTTRFTATKSGSQLRWNTASGATPIYFEDVSTGAGSATHTFTVGFGSATLVANQSTAALLHSADRMDGTLTLNANRRMLENSGGMTRRNMSVLINIAKGTGWATNGADFRARIAGATVRGFNKGAATSISPLVTAGASASTVEYILPVGQVPTNNGDKVLEITKGGVTHTLKLSADITSIAGQQVVILATYDNTGAFGSPGIELKDWVVVPHSGDPIPVDPN